MENGKKEVSDSAGCMGRFHIPWNGGERAVLENNRRIASANKCSNTKRCMRATHNRPYGYKE
jgi:hypothetical protein